MQQSLGKQIISYLFIIVGCLSVAAGFVFFISPYKFAPGGVYGISIIIHHLTHGMFKAFPEGLPIGTMSLLMDIPLTILGTKILGPRFGIKTVVGFSATAAFTSILEFTWGYSPLVPHEPLLSAIFGGVLVGVGCGLVFKSNATTGGTDIISMIICKYTHQPLGKLQIAVDSCVVVLALVAFSQWAIPLFSFIIIFITGKIIDYILQGANVEKALFVVSEKHDEIRNKIINELDRGGTYLNGFGMYGNQEKHIIFTVLSRREVQQLKDYISNIDPHAFIAVLEASEILGEGFKELKKED